MIDIPAEGSTTVGAQQGTIPVFVDRRTNPRVPMASQTIVIEGADAASLRYHID
jgi:hypothetical protein